MKKLIIPFLAAVCLFLGSCSEDFKVAAPYKNISVIYGTLSMNDTAHYIRIEKAFLDESKSAITMAQTPDSSFYKDLEVKLNEYTATENGTVVNFSSTTTLEKVDMNAEGYPKQSSSNGFFTAPSYGYKTKKQLKSAGYAYQLLVTNKATGRTDSSDVFGIVNGDTKTGSGNFYISLFSNANLKINFSKTLFTSKFSLNGQTPLYGKLMEGHIVFHYLEKNTNTGTEERKQADMLFGTAVQEPKGQFDVNTLNTSIYGFLRDEIGTAPAGVERYLDSCDLVVYAGSKELYTYQQINLGQSGGITGDQIKPIYTNMKGQNALGVIGSRAINMYYNVAIDSVTLDSLRANPLTMPLNIKGFTKD